MTGPFTQNERAIIRAYYEQVDSGAFDLTALAKRIGRPKTSVARAARQMGLTLASRPKSLAQVEKMSVISTTRIAERGHPRGFAGHQHTPEAKGLLSARSKAAWSASRGTGTGLDSEERRQTLSDRVSKWRSEHATTGYSRCRAGYRDDLGPIYFRSGWEANYARYLNFLRQRGDLDAWSYEPETFWFEAIRRGVRSYKPDFKITEKGTSYFIELKGWMDARSRTCLSRMAKYYPQTDLRLVGAKEYRAIAKAMGGVIPHWEGEGSPNEPVKAPRIHITITPREA